MIIRQVRVKNYKRFMDSGVVPLGPGFNVFVGPNDVGKTALLEAITLRPHAVPHRSLKTVPTPNQLPDPTSTVEMVLELSPGELVAHFSKIQAVSQVSNGLHGSQVTEMVENFVLSGGTATITHQLGLRTKMSLPDLPADGTSDIQILNSAFPTGYQPTFAGVATGAAHPFGIQVLNYVQSHLYAFRADRLPLGMGPVGSNRELSPRAENLPEVINELKSNPARFDRLIGHVREVFPHIHAITTRPTGPSHTVIEVWDFPLQTERTDLAVPLQESGTGIGQVLAILFVVVTADDPTVILIDEPHSFLHPGALRKLFSILASYSKHQFIITTHSPAAILDTVPTSLAAVRREVGGSVVVGLDPTETGDLQAFLDSVGARFSDVFGPDRILWVEGKTEEKVFRLLLDAYSLPDRLGLEIIAVQQTGDFDAKAAERAVSSYIRLSSPRSLLPGAVAFVLDPERRTSGEINDLLRLGGGDVVKVLPRPMIENYLLRPDAIFAVLSALDTEREVALSESEVEKWFEDHASDAAVLPKGTKLKWKDPDWPRLVHGARVLDALFRDLTEQRVVYEKVSHGVALAKEAIRLGDATLRELALDWLVPIVRGMSVKQAK